MDSTFKEPRLHLLPSFIIPQSDRKIVVAGEFLGGTNVRYNYALINPDGTVARVFAKLDRAYQMPARGRARELDSLTWFWRRIS